MEWLSGIGVLVGMLLLRLAAPLLITVALGWALHRLDAKWHPEATQKPDAGGQKQDYGPGRHTNQWIMR